MDGRWWIVDDECFFLARLAWYEYSYDAADAGNWRLLSTVGYLLAVAERYSRLEYLTPYFT